MVNISKNNIMMCSAVLEQYCYIDDFENIFNFISYVVIYAMALGTVIGIVILSIKER